MKAMQHALAAGLCTAAVTGVLIASTAAHASIGERMAPPPMAPHQVPLTGEKRPAPQKPRDDSPAYQQDESLENYQAVPPAEQDAPLPEAYGPDASPDYPHLAPDQPGSEAQQHQGIPTAYNPVADEQHQAPDRQQRPEYAEPYAYQQMSRPHVFDQPQLVGPHVESVSKGRPAAKQQAAANEQRDQQRPKNAQQRPENIQEPQVVPIQTASGAYPVYIVFLR